MRSVSLNRPIQRANIALLHVGDSANRRLLMSCDWLYCIRNIEPISTSTDLLPI